jgi:hypothetical protein
VEENTTMEMLIEMAQPIQMGKERNGCGGEAKDE